MRDGRAIRRAASREPRRTARNIDLGHAAASTSVKRRWPAAKTSRRMRRSSSSRPSCVATRVAQLLLARRSSRGGAPGRRRAAGRRALVDTRQQPDDRAHQRWRSGPVVARRGRRNAPRAAGRGAWAPARRGRARGRRCTIMRHRERGRGREPSGRAEVLEVTGASVGREGRAAVRRRERKPATVRVSPACSGAEADGAGDAATDLDVGDPVAGHDDLAAPRCR